MRIVAGEVRGRTIAAPSGDATRPTTDRVREALMSSLYSARGGFEGAIVLDAFAGSGALGLEALSRGAKSVVFYETDAKAAQCIKKNIEACGLDKSRARLVRADVMKSVPVAPGEPFDLVFCDPPYAYKAQDVFAMLAAMMKSGALADDRIVVYEHALKDSEAVELAAHQAGFTEFRTKKYGKTGIAIVQ